MADIHYLHGHYLHGEPQPIRQFIGIGHSGHRQLESLPETTRSAPLAQQSERAFDPAQGRR